MREWLPDYAISDSGFQFAGAAPIATGTAITLDPYSTTVASGGASLDPYSTTQASSGLMLDPYSTTSAADASALTTDPYSTTVAST